MLYRMVFYMYRILYVLLDGICILTVFILTVFFLFPLFLYFCYFPPNDVISKYPPTFVDILVKTTTYYYFRSRPIGRHNLRSRPITIDPPGICRLHGLTCFFFKSGLEVDNDLADDRDRVGSGWS